MAQSQADAQPVGDDHLSDLGMFRRLLGWVYPHRWIYGGLVLLLLFEAALGPALAWVMQVLTDAALAGERDTVLLVAVLAAGLVVVQMGDNYANTYLGTLAVERVKRDLKVSIFRKTLTLPARFFDRMHSGDVVSRLTHDIDLVSGALGATVLNLLRYPISGLVAFGYLLTINWQLAFLAGTVGPIGLLVARATGAAMRRNRRVLQAHLADVNGYLRDVFRGHVIVRAFTGEGDVHQRYVGQNTRTVELELVEARLSGVLSAGSLGTMFVSFLITVGVGSFYVVTGVMTAGELLGFFVLLQALTQPFRQLADVWAELQRGLAAAERLFELLDEEADPYGRGASGEAKGVLLHHQVVAIRRHAEPEGLHPGGSPLAIEFDQVFFSYDRQSPVLEGLSFRAPAGRVTGLVGVSGAGKSTIFRLTAGLERPDSGRILLGDAPIEALSPDTLYALLALVPQRTHLFTGTVYENIEFGCPGAGPDLVRWAARTAVAEQFVEKLADGYDTKVGEDGVTLSGGQRQRLAVARAVLKGAPVLLLDEATAHVDVETEERILANLRRLPGRTILLISHRPHVLRYVDHVVLLREGACVEEGSRSALLRSSGHFTRFLREES